MDDDDKSIIEKTIERVKDIAAKASEAAHKAIEPEPIKPGDAVVMMSTAAGGSMGDPVVRDATSLLLSAKAECRHHHGVQGGTRNDKSSIEAGFLRHRRCDNVRLHYVRQSRREEI
jgi:hypothetical protein